jgi:hypothetical protein
LVPAASAARAANISPSPWTRPISPVGASAIGIDTGSPSIVEAIDTSDTSISTRWRRRMALRSSRFEVSVRSS